MFSDSLFTFTHVYTSFNSSLAFFFEVIQIRSIAEKISVIYEQYRPEQFRY